MVAIKQYWSQYIEKVDELLSRPPLKKGFDLLEDKIKVGRKYIDAVFLRRDQTSVQNLTQ